MQTQLTNAKLQVQIADSQGEAELARARKQADQTVVVAEAELARSRRQAQQVVVVADAELEKSRRQAEQTVVTAQARSQERVLAGRGEAQRILQVGLSEASVLLRKIASFGDPRLYALSGVTKHLAHSSQPLVPERVFVAGAGGDGASGAGGPSGMLGLLINLLVAEKTGFEPGNGASAPAGLKDIEERLTREAIDSLQQAPAAVADK
jgi:multidrug efflux pump subunit AcrA (membrane-fusion protein)